MSESHPIVVEGLARDWEGTRAVDDVSFEVAAGRVVALVGPNGAGKTTTLRMMAGIVQPTAGTVALCGHGIATHPVAAKQHLGWVPHDPALFDALTVREHLELACDLWGVQVADADIDGWIERFHLSEKADAPTSALSRGQKQKVALASAAVHRPDVLLLDEPMTGLDPAAIRTMKAWVRAEADRGVAIILSSHLLGVVEDLCTDLIVLVKGRVRYRGTMEEARVALDGERLEELFFKATAEDAEGTG